MEEQLKENEIRFSGAPWFKGMKEWNISLIGAGTIGSWTALTVSRLQPNSMTIFDGDTFEQANMAGQLCTMALVNTPKATASVGLVGAFSNYSNAHAVNTYVDNYTDVITKDKTIVITGLDSMAARKVVWDNIKITYNTDIYLIDGRMTAEGLQIVTLNMSSKEQRDLYEKEWLISDEEAVGEVCSFKQTSHIGAIISGMIANIVTNIVNNDNELNEPRSIPFLVEYLGEHMDYKVIL